MFLFFSSTKALASATYINSWVKDGKSTSTADFSIAQSITPTSGNLLLLFATTKKDLASTPVISGWTSRGFNCAPNNKACTYSFSKIASGPETVSVLLDNQDRTNGGTITILEYKDAVNTLHSTITNSGNGKSVSTGSITTTHNQELLIAVVATDNNSSHGAWLNNFTQRVDYPVTSSGVETNVSVVDLTSNSIGTYSTGTTINKPLHWSTMIFNFDSSQSTTSDLVLSKTVTNTNPAVYQNFTYSLSVYNSGASENINVQVTDTLSPNLVLVSSSPSTGTTYNQSTGVWNIGNINYGETKTLTLVQYASTLASGQTITNTANISSYGVTDPNLTNNTATRTITVKPISSTPVINSPIVSGDTTVSGASSGPNGTTIKVYNGAILVGTATVSNGTWSSTVPTVSGGNQISAKATFPGGSESEYSQIVTVLFKTTPPVITIPVSAGDTQIIGTTSEANGTSIEVFLNNTLLGTTTSNSGSWSLSVSKPTLISGQLLKVRATAVGKYISDFSGNVTVIDAVSPVPAITNSIVAGDTFIQGSSTGADGTLIEIYKTRNGTTTTVGNAVVSSNNWVISGLLDSEIRSGDRFTAKARIDTNNDGLNNSSDTYSNLSTEVIASLRISQAPSINPANSLEVSISGSSVGNNTTLIKVYKNDTYLTSTNVLNNIWSVATVALVFGDQYKATATFDNNNDGIIDGSDTASAYSSTIIVGGSQPSNAPIIDHPISAGANTVSGESSENDGTLIEVFVNNISIGTTTTSSNSWELTFPVNTLQTGETVTAKATATGKYTSVSSSGVVVIDSISPVPSISTPIIAGDTSINGSSTGTNGTYITVYKNRGGVISTVGNTSVLNNLWTLSGISSSEIRTGDIFTAKARMDTNNDGTNDSSDSYSLDSTQVTAIPRISQVPYITQADSGQTYLEGGSVGSDGTLIKIYKNNSYLNQTTVYSNLWSLATDTLVFGDEYKATATFDTNNDGVIDGGDIPSAYSSVMIIGGTAVTRVPIINSPITAGDISVSGTSDEIAGTTIEVFANGSSLGTTTITGTSWNLNIPSNSLQTGENITARARAPGKSDSALSTTVVVVNKIPPTPSVNFLTAGDTEITGSVLAPNGSIIEVIVDGIQINSTTVNSNSWSLTVPSSELQTGEKVKARTHIDYNNDGTIELDDFASSLSSEITVVTRISQIPTINPAYEGQNIISGTSSGNNNTLIKIYKNNSYLSSVNVVNKTWSLATTSLVYNDQYKATATFDNNNDGLVDGSDLASDFSSTIFVGGLQPTNAPTITPPIIAGALKIVGESIENDGTNIEVFVNGASIGNTTTSQNLWEITIPSNTLQTGEVVTAKATASGKSESSFSTGITVVNQIPPTPTVSPLRAGDTTIKGVVLAPNGSLIEVLVDGVQIGSTTVNSNSWNLTVAGSTLQTGEIVRARTHIDYNNDGSVELDDNSSSLSTNITVTSRISPVPVLDPIGFSTKVITGNLSPIGVTKIYIYRLRSGSRTLLGTTQTNSPSFFLNEIISNPWVIGDSITATSITDTNNDGGVDDNDIQSIDSETQIIYDDSTTEEEAKSSDSSCNKPKPNGYPLIYRIEAISQNKLKIYFNPLNQPRDKYEYEYVNLKSTFKFRGVVLNYIKGHFEIGNLFEGDTYKIRIRPVNDCAKGTWSEYKFGTPKANFNNILKPVFKSEIFKNPFEVRPFDPKEFKLFEGINQPISTNKIDENKTEVEEDKSNNVTDLGIYYYAIGIITTAFGAFFIIKNFINKFRK